MTVNLKTASALGLTMVPTLLAGDEERSSNGGILIQRKHSSFSPSRQSRRCSA